MAGAMAGLRLFRVRYLDARPPDGCTKVQVLVGDGNQVLGTFNPAGLSGNGVPAQAGFQAGPGQRVVEVNLDDSVLQLPPDALHKKIEADHLA